MKKSIFILLLLYGNIFLFGQNFELKIKLHPNEKIKSHNNSIYFEEKLSEMNRSFNSRGLEARYPNANNPELALYYNFKGKGNIQDAIQELKAHGIFESIAEVDSFQTTFCLNPELPDDPLSDYAMDLIEANCAWSISKGCPSVYIGIADTDFEDTHEDLEDQIAWLDGQVSANQHHGTAVAGMAAAETNNNLGISAIGYNSKISARRIPHSLVYNSEGVVVGASASGSSIANAIWHLYQEGRLIINVSWSGSGLDLAAAEEITQNGTVLVLSGGNLPTSTNHSHIADIPGVIIVTSVNYENKHAPSGHAHNQWIDICAPGVNVTTTRAENSYSPGSGTSLATPIVSGIIALMLEVNPCLTPAEIELLIKESADPVADAADFEGLLGAGRLNAYQALILAGTRSYDNETFIGDINLSAGFGFNLNNVSIGADSNVSLVARKEVNVYGTFELPLGSTLSIDTEEGAQTNCQ